MTSKTSVADDTQRQSVALGIWNLLGDIIYNCGIFTTSLSSRIRCCYRGEMPESLLGAKSRFCVKIAPGAPDQIVAGSRAPWSP